LAGRAAFYRNLPLARSARPPAFGGSTPRARASVNTGSRGESAGRRALSNKGRAVPISTLGSGFSSPPVRHHC
jgi:hypothetical protein